MPRLKILFKNFKNTMVKGECSDPKIYKGLSVKKGDLYSR